MSVLLNKISVIIPTFNRKALVAKTIANILEQTLVPDEIIVVDDHSDDGTFEFLKAKFKDQIILILNEGKGPGAARNTGFEISTGDYIKFFDSDDLMTKNTFEIQLEELQKSDKFFIYSPYFCALEKENGLWEQTDSAILNYLPFPQRYNLTQWMLHGLFVTIPSMLFRRELLRSVGPWRSDMISSEDLDYLFRISLKEALPAHTNACAFLYRIHGPQTTENHFNKEERDQQKLICLSELYDRYVKHNSTFNYWQKKLFEVLLYQTVKNYPSDLNFFRPYLNEYNTTSNKVIWEYIRIKKKIGRYKTSSHWQPENRPLKSKEQFEHYLELIKS
jgi:glycosyltransferase involved in cell wall biosynthesis